MLRPIKPPVKPLRIPLAATLLLCCAALGVVEAKSADRRSAPLPGLDQGITVPTHIRDAVPSDCPNLLYCKSCDEEHFLEGWTGTYTVYKNTKGEFRGFDIEQATSPALDFSGAVRPVMCIENISGTFSISTDGNNFVKCLSRGKYIEIPPTTKYIRITNGRLNSLLFIIDAAKEGPEYPTDLGKNYITAYYLDGEIHDYSYQYTHPECQKVYFYAINSEVFSNGTARISYSGNDIYVIAKTENEFIRVPATTYCSDYKRNYHFIPVGTKAVYAFANDPTQDCYIVYNFLTDDAKAFHTATLETPTSPLKKAAWYDINGDGILDFVGNGVYIWTGNGYNGFKFGEKTIYGNLVNVGGDNGILWYSNYVRHIDTANFSAPILDGDEADTKHVYYPADVNNDGRYDLMRLSGGDEVADPKRFVSLSPDGKSLTVKYDVMPVSEYLNMPIQGSTGDIQSALASMSGMGIYSPPVYEKSKGVKFESHDINNDGMPDIVDYVHGKIYYNIGENRYATTDFGGQMIVRDLNGDGIEDFIIADDASETITSHIQIPEGGITEKTLLSGYYIAGDIYSADFNADGLVDVLIPIKTESYNDYCTFVLILENKGNGSFKRHECPLTEKCNVFDMRDLDNDGVYELWLTPQSSKSTVQQFPISNFKLAATPTSYESSNGISVETSGTVPAIYPDVTDPSRNMLYFEYRGIVFEPAANTVPKAPARPDIFYEPSTGMIKVSWQPTTDKETPAADLTYSLRIGTAPDLDDIVTADALPDGRRRNITGGNMSYSLQRKFDTRSWPDGKIYISVQAVDGANGGSPFSEYAVLEKREPTSGFLLSYEKPFAVNDVCTATLSIMPKEGYTYQWDFDGARIISADESSQTYEIAYDTGGEKTISLTVTANGYTSPTVSQTLDVHPGNVKQHELISDGYSATPDWAADIDEDGEYELYRSNFLESSKPGEYTSIQRLFNNHSSIRTFSNGVHADINGDGHVDIYNPGGTGAINMEDKDMEIVTDLFKLPSYDYEYFMDLDNNGKLDFVNRLHPSEMYFNADYKGFEKYSPFTGNEYNWAAYWLDFNGDGLIDFATTSYDANNKLSLNIYENQGDYTFEKRTLETNCSDFRLIAIRDFDNNGTLDLLGSRTIARDRYTLSIIWDNGKGDETPFTGKMGDIDSFTVVMDYELDNGRLCYTHDFDNNGYIDFYAIAPKDVQTERGIWGYMIYQLPGHKFEIKKYDHDANDYGFGLEQAVGANSELFLANDGHRHLTDIEVTIDTPNSRPDAPKNLRHSQNTRAVVLEWDPSVDKETPAAAMRYNVSIKRKGVEGEGAYLFSPCNGGKNGVPVPTHKPLLGSSRLTIPIFNIPAGTYEVQVQGVDLMHEASDFSEVYEMTVDEECNLDIPASGVVGYPVKVGIYASIATDPDWDGGEAKSSGSGRYNVVWHTPGRKCVTIGDKTVYIQINPAPDPTFTLPEVCHRGDRVKISAPDTGKGKWEIHLANKPYDWEPLSDTDDSRFATLEIIDDDNAVLTFRVTNRYDIRHTLSEGIATEEHTETVEVVWNNTPTISLVDIHETTGKHRIRWQAPSATDTDITGLNLYKETSVAGKYVLLEQLAPNVTSYTDLTSTPDAKASRYMMTYELTYGESDRSAAHTPIHVMINRGIGDSWNLIWTRYEGVTVDSYRILRGNSPESLAMIDEVSGNMTSFCDVNPPAGPLFYAVEIINPASAAAPQKAASRATATGTYSRSNVVVATGDASVNMVERIEVFSVNGENTIDYSQTPTLDLQARIYPYNATLTSPNWIIVSGDDIATVDARGRVTATGRGNGQVTVRACAIDGSGASGEFIVTVKGVVSGIESVDAASAGRLTVNPPVAQTEIHVAGLPGGEQGRTQLYIFGVNGVIAHEATLSGREATINVSTLTDGVYIIKAVGENSTADARFIKH